MPFHELVFIREKSRSGQLLQDANQQFVDRSSLYTIPSLYVSIDRHGSSSSESSSLPANTILPRTKYAIPPP